MISVSRLCVYFIDNNDDGQKRDQRKRKSGRNDRTKAHFHVITDETLP